MKKIAFLLIALFAITLMAVPAFAQYTIFTDQATRPNGHDSDIVEAAVNGAIGVANVVTGRKPLIPFLPDAALGTVVSSVVFFFIRIFEKRRLRRRGLLKDKNHTEGQNNEPGSK